jgi:hypothetical protein
MDIKDLVPVLELHTGDVIVQATTVLIHTAREQSVRSLPYLAATVYRGMHIEAATFPAGGCVERLQLDILGCLARAVRLGCVSFDFFT